MRVALVTGSGLSAVAGLVAGQRRRWEPPGLEVRPAAPGHAMEVVRGTFGGCEALAFAGRLHWYQGYSAAEVAAPVREAAAWGAEALFLTNAAGALDPALAPGSLLAIRDHLNLIPDNPLRGEPAFVEMAGAYDEGLRGLAREAAAGLGLELAEGVYAAFPGPSFETPAEVRMLRLLGADVVGMSTVPEVIAARRLGLRVLAVSLVTNAAGADPEAVLGAAREGAARLGALLEAVARRLASVR